MQLLISPTKLKAVCPAADTGHIELVAVFDFRAYSANTQPAVVTDRPAPSNGSDVRSRMKPLGFAEGALIVSYFLRRVRPTRSEL
jgi:hypothetical protein